MGSTPHPCLYQAKNTKKDYHGGEKAGVNVAQEAKSSDDNKGVGMSLPPPLFCGPPPGERIRGGPASYGRPFFLDV